MNEALEQGGAAGSTTGPTGAEAIEALLRDVAPQSDVPARVDFCRFVGRVFGAEAEANARVRVGRFEIERLIGSGGMGDVYAARDTVLDRRVALKMLRSDPAGREGERRGQARLLREAQAIARVRHPNLVVVHEAGVHEGQVYLVMDLIEGPTLTKWLELRRSFADVARLFLQAGRALAAIHDAGLVHRDFKPDNVIVGTGRRAVVLDFGLARPPRRRQRDAASPVDRRRGDVTRTGALAGTPRHMAPEQHTGGTVDARSDQWAFCACLFEALYGRPPFSADDEMTLVRDKVSGKLPELPRPEGATRRLERAIQRGLSARASERFPSMDGIVTALEHALSPWPRAPAVAVVLAAVLGVVVAWAAWTDLRRREQRHNQARALIAASRLHMDRGELRQAWARLRTVELSFADTPAIADAYWALVDLAARERAEDNVLAQELWLRRLLARDPSRRDRASAEHKLGRVYDRYGFLPNAAAAYARALSSGDLAPDAEHDARLGLSWVRLRQRQARSDIQAFPRASADLDGDGRDEVIALAPPGTLVALGLEGERLVERTNWNVPEVEPRAVSGVLQPVSATWVDAVGDGRRELVLFGAQTTSTEALVLDLTRSTSIVVGKLPGERGAAGDFDGDGNAELVTVTQGPERAMWLHRRQADGALGTTRLDLDLATPESDVLAIAAGDLDGDGREELLWAEGSWTRYDVRVGRIEGTRVMLGARSQVGLVTGLAIDDFDGDSRRDLFVLKSHELPSPRLFEDDPYLGPSGPRRMSVRDGRLVETWRHDLVGRDSDARSFTSVFSSRRTALGAVAGFREPERGVLHLYFETPAGPAHRMLDRIATRDPREPAATTADLDGDGLEEILVAAERVVAYGVGRSDEGPALPEGATGIDWLSTARRLRQLDHAALALDAYEMAEADGASPGEIAFERAQALSSLGRPREALEELDRARAQGVDAPDVWRATVEAAEATGDWAAALEASLRLGDADRARALGELLTPAPVFAQDFTRPLAAAWQILDPVPCRRASPERPLTLELFPGDRGLELPLEWDGSSIQVHVSMSLVDLQYAKSATLSFAPEAAPLLGVEARLTGTGGGGRLQLGAALAAFDGVLRSDLDVRAIDWRVAPQRIRLTLRYAAHVAQWELVVQDASGSLLRQASVRLSGPPPAGSWRLKLSGVSGGSFVAASILELERLEIRSARGGARIRDVAGDDSRRRFCNGDDSGVDAAREPLLAAFAAARRGQAGTAAAHLRAYERAAKGQLASSTFELDSWRPTLFDVAAVRLALRDLDAAEAVLVGEGLMPPERFADLLLRATYQQLVDSGQTRWREAIPRLDRVLALAPDDARARYFVGYCRLHLGELAEASDALAAAWELDPGLEQRFPKQGGPAVLLAKIAGHLGDRASARAWIDAARDLDGNLDSLRHDPRLMDLGVAPADDGAARDR